MGRSALGQDRGGVPTLAELDDGRFWRGTQVLHSGSAGGFHRARAGGLSLARPILSGKPGTPLYAQVYESRGIVERHDRSKFSDPDFQAKFYADMDKAVQTIEANIDQDLHKDPRWGVFLIERITGRL